MPLGADALRFVLAQGVPAVIEVAGRSMEPTIALGAKVEVAALAEGDAVALGDVVLVATGGDGLVLHRVMAAFDEDGEPLVVHQGDARPSTFAIASRRDVLARVTGLAGDAGPAPTPERLSADARAVYRRRRVAVDGFLAAPPPVARAAPRRRAHCAAMCADLSPSRARRHGLNELSTKYPQGKSNKSRYVRNFDRERRHC
jgi:hypothetical protein